jgi:hypothetical protein
MADRWVHIGSVLSVLLLIQSNGYSLTGNQPSMPRMADTP